jgi:hypothetical protein
MTELLTEPTRDLTTRLDDELKREELRRRQGERLERRGLLTLVSGADTLAYIVLAVWKRVRETLASEGFEGGELTRHCQILLDGIDGILTGYDQLRKMAEASGLTPEAAGLGDLETKLPALREARPEVALVLGLATRPPRPVDGQALAESRAALDRGEFVTINDDYLARLRAGEDD